MCGGCGGDMMSTEQWCVCLWGGGHMMSLVCRGVWCGGGGGEHDVNGAVMCVGGGGVNMMSME